jgi:hypothetical protein
MLKNVRLVSIHDVLTNREARSDPTGSRARIRGEPLPEPASRSHAKQEPEPPLHGRALSGVPVPEARAPLHGWALARHRKRGKYAS